jgi:hypothetical protein
VNNSLRHERFCYREKRLKKFSSFPQRRGKLNLQTFLEELTDLSVYDSILGAANDCGNPKLEIKNSCETLFTSGRYAEFVRF